MMPDLTIQPRPWPDSPEQVASRWPVDRPLLMLHSARTHERRARWSILAAADGFYQFDGRSRWMGRPPAGPLGDIRFHDDPTADVDRLLEVSAAPRPAGSQLPFHGGWIGMLGYELGRVLEPVAGGPDPAADDRGWPLITLAWCPRALVYDHLRQRWHDVGGSWPAPPQEPSIATDPWVAGSLRAGLAPVAYRDGVARVLSAIAAGDIFQANFTQRFTASFDGSTRALALRALSASGAWYGASLELPGGRAVISLSPELFLEVDATSRRVTTRPIKGTLPARRDPEELRRSVKDAAELHMIVDLMRNDLGRVCAFGSIGVPDPRAIETHATVHHGVGEVTGRLRPDVTAGDLIRATFPAGSVTGVPKIRAMQIIESLEPVRRGPYCGAIGYFSRCGQVALNVGIRTLALSGERPAGRWDQLRGVLDYGAGGGIVADSDPAAEWSECLDKTVVLRRVLRPRRAAVARTPTPTSSTPADLPAGSAGAQCSARSGPPRTAGGPG